MDISDTEAALWIRRFADAPDAPARLVCFPHAGGAASFFQPVARALAPVADVISLQYPGRQDRRREPVITSVEEYAARLTAVLGGLPPKPTVYFGHSMGAILAFEVAHRTAAGGGDAPASLVASGRRGPATVREEFVHLLGDDGIIAEVQELGGTDTALLDDEEIRRMALPAIRGDFTAIETYSCPPDRLVPCPVTVFIGDIDPKVTAEEARTWQQHTTGAFAMHVYPGGHFFLVEHSADVLARLRSELTRVATTHAVRA
ncbi:alpha/beta fold hydrolase [Amycolatopsis sp. NPDC004169]|uniref:thioesterase II family protein n=1 Tax=Amycolatopsis sp. NPDC004169 TaxID=3154453 RepID=UPI0033B72E2C